MLGCMQLFQISTDDLTLIEFTTCQNNRDLVWINLNLLVDPQDIVDHCFYPRNPTLGAKLLYGFAMANVHARLMYGKKQF